MLVSTLLALAMSPTAHAAPDISPALVEPRKAKWDPKGKAMNIYLQARIQLKKEDWDAATELYVQSIEKQEGCGKCLNELGDVLIGAERYDDAAKTGELLAKLYPDKINGWANVANAMRKKRSWQPSIDALDKVIEIDPDASWAWADRTDSYIQLGETNTPLDLLDTAEEAGLKEGQVACLRVVVHTARDDAEAAREQWEAACADSKDANLRRPAEGWLALVEGDAEKAAKALMRAGSGDAIRLAMAMARYQEGKLEASVNLADKLLGDLDWEPWDAHVIKARALFALEKKQEALDQLQVEMLADDWADAHANADMSHVLLKAKGKGWSKELGLTATELGVRILSDLGEADQAQAMYDQAVEIYGETEGLKAAIAPPEGEEEEEGDDADE